MLLLNVPVPFSKSLLLEGTVTRTEPDAGSRHSVIWVRLDDGTRRSFEVDRLRYPQPGTRVAVTVRTGLLGQRLYSSVDYTLPSRATD